MTLILVIVVVPLGVLANVLQLAGSVSTSHPVSTFTSSATSTPFTTPAQSGEYLIIVAQFQDDSEARNLDVQTVLANGIREVLTEKVPARVEVAPDLAPGTEQKARALGTEYNATIILWGRCTDNFVEVNFTPLAQLDTPIQAQEYYTVETSIDDLAIKVNTRAPGTVRQLSLFTIGQALYLAGRFDSAMAQFNAALALPVSQEVDPKQLAAIHFYRGTIYTRYRDLEQAAADFGQAIELNPELGVAYHNRGLTYAEREDFGKALTDYHKAIALDTDDANAYFNRGWAYFRQHDFEHAEVDFTKAIELGLKTSPAYYNRGVTSSAQGKWTSAVADFTSAIALDPAYAEAYSGRGSAHYSQGELEQAVQDYTQAINLDQTMAAAYYGRGITFFEYNVQNVSDQEALARAIADYTQAITLDSEYADAFRARGDAYSRQEKWDLAIADYTQTIALTPQSTLAFTGRGLALLAHGKPGPALSDFTQAIALDPQNATAYLGRGFVYETMNEPEKAIADFRKVLELSDDPVWRQAAEQELKTLEKK